MVTEKMDLESIIQFCGKTEVFHYRSWKDEELEDGDSVSFGDLESLGFPYSNAPTMEDFYLPRLLSGSDYGNSNAVEVSNLRVFLKEYEDVPGVHKVYGAYGSFGVVIRLSVLAEHEEMRDLLKGLEDYPVLDEDDLSKVEMEAEDVAWTSWTEGDYKKVLLKSWTASEDEEEALETFLDGLPEGLLREAFETSADRVNEYWINETGNAAYIDVERVAKGTKPEDLGWTAPKAEEEV
jgi:hypothetical protein